MDCEVAGTWVSQTCSIIWLKCLGNTSFLSLWQGRGTGSQYATLFAEMVLGISRIGSTDPAQPHIRLCLLGLRIAGLDSRPHIGPGRLSSVGEEGWGQGGLRRKLLHHLHPPRKCSAEQKRSPPPPIVITPGPKSCCQSHIWRIWSIWEQHQMGWVIVVGTLKPWHLQFDNRKYRWRCAVPWNLFHSSSFLKLVDMDTH